MGISKGDEQAIEDRFPETDTTIGYGSGFFGQVGNGWERMLDMIKIVRWSANWHWMNMWENELDYARVPRLIGPKAITALQRAAGWIWYNTDIPSPQGRLKYGVVELDDATGSLEDWSQGAYLAGRLGKRVSILHASARMTEAMEKNLKNHVMVALLMLWQSFTFREFLLAIIKLSYIGDIRMMMGFENPNKVPNILDGEWSFERFRDLYAPILFSLKSTLSLPSDKPAIDLEMEDTIHQDMSPNKTEGLFKSLPFALAEAVQMPETYDRESAWRVDDVRNRVQKGLVRIEFFPILLQSAKGLITHDRWLDYLKAKRAKAIVA